MGRGGAFAARASDPFALYYNPAGLTAIERRTAYLSLGGLVWNSAFTRAPLPEGATEGGSTVYPYGTSYPTAANEGIQPTPLPAAFFIWPLPWRRITLGAGFMTPVGPLFLDFPDDGPQRYMILDATRTENYLMAGGAVELGAGLSAGGAFYLDSATLRYRQAITSSAHPSESPAREGTAELDVAKFGAPSFIAGVRFERGRFFAGTAYQRGADVEMTGTLDARLDTRLNEILGMGMFGTDPVNIDARKDARVKLALPNVIRTGLGWRFGRLYTEADVNLWQWSRFREFRIKLDDPSIPLSPPLEIGVSLSGFDMSQSVKELTLSERVIPQEMKDVFDFRLGAEYAWSDRTDVRAGVLYQPEAMPARDLTPLTYDAPTLGLTGGFSRRWGRWRLDASAGAYLLLDRRSTESRITAFNGMTGVDQANRDVMERLLGYSIEDSPVGDGSYEGSAFLFMLGTAYEF